MSAIHIACETDHGFKCVWQRMCASCSVSDTFDNCVDLYGLQKNYNVSISFSLNTIIRWF